MPTHTTLRIRLGRLLCKIGLHRYRSDQAKLAQGLVKDTTRCTRPGCPEVITYVTEYGDPHNW